MQGLLKILNFSLKVEILAGRFEGRKCLIFFFFFFLLFVPGSEDKNYEMSTSAESPCWPFPELAGE